jgi:trehalose 6-phosphate phosphatase
VTYLFSRSSRGLLARLAWSNVLLAFDYDGTLAPLVGAPARASLRASTRRLLKEACRLYPTVVISGRGRADAVARLRGITRCRVIGNHGAEPSPGAAAMRRRVRRWLPVLKARLSGRRGVVIEDKGFSVTLHYRHARRRDAARRTILRAARGLDARIVGGTLAVNLVLPDAPNKGSAVRRECLRIACDTAVFVGDDVTDEDVFRLEKPGRLVSVRVGRKRASAAQYYIRNQAEMDRLLEILVALRRTR